MKNLEIGAVYKHYKGTKVKVLFEAIHSENQEHLIIYMHLEDGVIWARPKHMFCENVVVGGKEIERFQKVEQEILIKPR
jgi:cyclomaltodextrinase / maltogenic alpha-amylase / neopullulanase